MSADLEGGGPTVLKEIDSFKDSDDAGQNNRGRFASRLNQGMKQFRKLEKGPSVGMSASEAEESLLSLAPMMALRLSLVERREISISSLCSSHKPPI